MNSIALVVADVDGTLVTQDKRLTDASRQAVRDLAAAGIAFAITSSRPPLGLRMIIDTLALRLPSGAFNGGSLVAPDLGVLEQRLIPATAAAEAVDLLTAGGSDVWVFAADRWLLRNPRGPYVDRERLTLQAEPTLVDSFAGYLEQASKIVGVSDDFDRLAAQEIPLRTALGDRASVARSQRYYLDVTPAGVSKGTFVDALARRLDIPRAGIASIGDMDNDVPMFQHSGLSIAMGNATDAVKRQADRTTLSNEEDGFAAAVAQLLADGGGKPG